MGKFKIIYEKLSIEAIRKYYGYWNKSYYDDWFGKNVYRVYLDADTGKSLEGNESFKFSKNKDYKDIEDVLIKNGYEIENWEAGLAKKIGSEKNFIKIGKILQRFNIDLKKKYDLMRDPSSKLLGKNDEKLLIVISRHPYDIAGMTADREWKSCMEIDKQTGKYGSLSSSIIAYIKENALISYLIKNDDKNINNPIGRILIYPYKNESGKVYLYPSEKYYGKIISNMRNIIMKWLNKKQRNLKNILKPIGKMYMDNNPLLLYLNIDKIDERLSSINFKIDRTMSYMFVNNKIENVIDGYLINGFKYFFSFYKKKNIIYFNLYDVKTKSLIFSVNNENDFIEKINKLER